MARPLILLPPDLTERQGKRGPIHELVSQRQYADAIEEAGGIAWVASPSTNDAVLDDMVAAASALVLAGGAFDVDPALYGEEKLPVCGEIKPERSAFEKALLLRCEARGLPVLGVCGGMQLMNVVRGGSLWQDLDSQVGTKVQHQQVGPKDQPGHGVRVQGDSQLGRIVAAHDLPVNSTHHQAVRRLGNNLVITARATDDDGVEAIEDPHKRFFVGVQWHPESMRETAHRAIYKALVDAARDASRAGR